MYGRYSIVKVMPLFCYSFCKKYFLQQRKRIFLGFLVCGSTLRPGYDVRRFRVLPRIGMTLPNWRMNFSTPPVAAFTLRFRRAGSTSACGRVPSGNPPLQKNVRGMPVLFSARVNSLTSPLLGAQELDSDEPSLCVHQPGRTVEKMCPRHALPP